jgi:hypothetical protein
LVIRDVRLHDDHDGLRPRGDFAEANAILGFFIRMVAFRIAFFVAASGLGAGTRLGIIPIPGASTTTATTLGPGFIAVPLIAIAREFLSFDVGFVQFGFEGKIVVVPMMGIDHVIIDSETESRGLAIRVASASAGRGRTLGVAWARSTAITGLASLAIAVRATASVLLAVFRSVFLSGTRPWASAPHFGFIRRNGWPSIARFATSSAGLAIVRGLRRSRLAGVPAHIIALSSITIATISSAVATHFRCFRGRRAAPAYFFLVMAATMPRFFRASRDRIRRRIRVCCGLSIAASTPRRSSMRTAVRAEAKPYFALARILGRRCVPGFSNPRGLWASLSGTFRYGLGVR